jgi:hypothetical protein
MIYLLYIIFFILCFLVLIRILNEFRNEFDWFSGTLYALIFIICCGLLWIFIFGIYYLIIGELY